MSVCSSLAKIDAPELIFLAGTGIVGFSAGATMAYLASENAIGTGLLMGVSFAAKYAMFRGSEMYVEAAKVAKENIPALKQRCTTGNIAISAAAVTMGFASKVLGPVGCLGETAVAAFLSYTIPRSESLEVAAKMARKNSSVSEK